MVENIKKYGPIILENDYFKITYNIYDNDMFCEWYDKRECEELIRNRDFETGLFDETNETFCVSDDEQEELEAYIKQHWPAIYLLGCL